jgi:hypothetical protein
MTLRFVKAMEPQMNADERRWGEVVLAATQRFVADRKNHDSPASPIYLHSSAFICGSNLLEQRSRK